VTTDAAFAALILHEMGHALGIGGHSTDPLDAMAAVPTAGVVTSRDSRTLRYVVHRPAELLL
jgi:predicted Zn-dependent protease